MERLSLSVDGAYILKPLRRGDERGVFTRLFCRAALDDAGLDAAVAQVNHSHSPVAGTMRGLHWQAAPFAETKLLTCLSGALFDVIVDLRPASPSFGRWTGVAMQAGDGQSVYVPAGCAHGFLTTAPDTGVVYTTSQPHQPGAQGTMRWNDPWAGIDWPMAPVLLSDTDRNAPDFDPATLLDHKAGRG